MPRYIERWHQFLQRTLGRKMKKSALSFVGALLLTPSFLFAQTGVSKPVLTPAPTKQTASETVTSGAAANPREPNNASNSLASSSTYVIGPEDVLLVTVWKEPSFSGTFTVRPDGVISLPLLGDIPSSGMTPLKLSDDIATRLRKYMNSPLVTVGVQSVNSKRVYLVGQVGHVGPLPLTPNMNPLEAIATAGGPAPFANLKHIYLLRNVGGKQKRIPFNYKTALKSGDMQGITLMPGDTIVVP